MLPRVAGRCTARINNHCKTRWAESDDIIWLSTWSRSLTAHARVKLAEQEVNVYLFVVFRSHFNLFLNPTEETCCLDPTELFPVKTGVYFEKTGCIKWAEIDTSCVFVMFRKLYVDTLMKDGRNSHEIFFGNGRRPRLCSTTKPPARSTSCVHSTREHVTPEMNKLRQSLRRKKPAYVPEASRPHQWQADEEAVRKGKCNFPVRVSIPPQKNPETTVKKVTRSRMRSGFTPRI